MVAISVLSSDKLLLYTLSSHLNCKYGLYIVFVSLLKYFSNIEDVVLSSTDESAFINIPLFGNEPE